MDGSVTHSTLDFLPTLAERKKSPIFRQYQALQSAEAVSWSVQYRMLERIGVGSQGDVWLADRLGSLGVSLRVALKFFSPRPYATTDLYLAEMTHTARVAIRIAEIQQDNLLDVHNFVESGGVQIMVMEWIDGFDLKHLTQPQVLSQVAGGAGKDRWDKINDVVATAGPQQVRFKPGVALAVLRECLAGLAQLHRRKIVHGDIKPSNVMLKRTGNAKMIDFGSAFDVNEQREMPAWTPRYVAPEVLETGRFEMNSDVASIGYVFLELLAGRVPFRSAQSREDLFKEKQTLHQRLETWLPRDVARDTELVELIRRMIHPDPAERFPSPADADLAEGGAASAQRRLVLGDLASEYANDIREWLRFVPPQEAQLAS
ncbi:protein kinase [bacterium]|nr:protein kinase [bacterium]